MNMNLEDHLRRLTDPVAAPPTERAREAITHRKGVLRCRHQTVRAVGASVFVALLVAGLVILRGGATGTVDTGPAGPGRDTIGVTVDGKGGWEITEVSENTGPPPFVADGSDMSVQVFQKAGEPTGPTIFLVQTFPTDANSYDGWPETEIGQFTGHILRTGTNRFRLEWARGDDLVTVIARGITQDEVLKFARQLMAKDDSYGPGQPNISGTLGFNAEYVPAGLSEQKNKVWKPVTYRMIYGKTPNSEPGAGWTVTMSERGPYGFQTVQEQGLVDADVQPMHMKLAGQAALVYDESRTKGTWTAVMQIGDVQVVTTLVGDATTATEATNHIELLDKAEWERLLDKYSGSADGSVGQDAPGP